MRKKYERRNKRKYSCWNTKSIIKNIFKWYKKNYRRKIENLKNEDDQKQIKKIENELAILVVNQPVDLEETKKYWMEVIKNGKQ